MVMTVSGEGKVVVLVVGEGDDGGGRQCCFLEDHDGDSWRSTSVKATMVEIVTTEVTTAGNARYALVHESKKSGSTVNLHFLATHKRKDGSASSPHVVQDNSSCQLACTNEPNTNTHQGTCRLLHYVRKEITVALERVLDLSTEEEGCYRIIVDEILTFDVELLSGEKDFWGSHCG